MSAVYYCKFVK